MENILTSLPKPFFALAPMDDVTDTVFRQMVAECAPPDLFFTEFVNVDGLQSAGRSALLPRLRFSADDQPIIAQIWGKQPEHFYETARQLVDAGFAGIDLNMGCPDRTAVKNGTCSALILNRPLAAEIIQAVREGCAGRIPVSVKTRLGFNDTDFSWHEFLLNQRLDMLTIHGRTRRQMSKVPADWEAIANVRSLRDRLSPSTLIVGNGDVASRTAGVELATRHKLDGIMIGRGIFHDPFVFMPGDTPWDSYTPAQRIELFSRHVELFARTWLHGERNIRSLNKFCKLYIHGWDGSKEQRERLMRAESVDELKAFLSDLRQLART